jgi:transcriptional regulator with XRE-family HTH domain
MGYSRASRATARAMAKRLLRVRMESGLNRTQFAGLLGQSSQRWIHYEAGTRTPDMETLIWLHRYRGVSLDWLIAGTRP